MGSVRQARERDQSKRDKVLHEALRDFDRLWGAAGNRLFLCPAKEVVSELNQRLQTGGHNAVSPVGLARVLRQDEIPDEMTVVLGEIEAEIRAP